jgi:hypothetical protein
LPPSLITAAAAGAAAGKNPWLPFGVLFLLAAFGHVPRFLMEPGMHRGLHALAAPEVFFALAILFLVLAVLDSFADKVHWIECWLTPLSAAWRPFAAIGVSVLIAHAVAVGEDPSLLPGGLVAPAIAPLASAAGFGGGSFPGLPLEAAGSVTAALTGGGAPALASGIGSAATGWLLFLTTLLVGTLFGLLATIGKIGTRLLLALLPVPHLKLAHSFLDDLFACCVTLLGLCFSQGPLSWFATGAGVLYLLVGLIVGPALTRLTLIQFRTAWALVAKTWCALRGSAAVARGAPGWLVRWLAEQGYPPEPFVTYPAYTYRAPGLGRFRSGHLVWSATGMRFVTRHWLRARELEVPTGRLARVGIAESVTTRQVVVTEECPGEPAREHVFTLFPALATEVEAVLARGAEVAGWERVRPRSRSARRGLPGHGSAPQPPRFVAAAAAGRLELQGMVTVLVAVVVGVLTVGAVVPVGAGYLLSPFRRRFALGLAVTAYLSLLALTGAGWPVAVFYGVLLNVVALRDLARQAVKAHVDGYVDRTAFLPPVCGAVFVARDRVLSEEDRGAGEPLDSMMNASWRRVARALRREPAPGATEPAPS